MTNNIFTNTIFIQLSFLFFFVYTNFQSIASLLSYSIIMYDIKLYTIVHIKSSQCNFEVIVKLHAQFKDRTYLLLLSKGLLDHGSMNSLKMLLLSKGLLDHCSMNRTYLLLHALDKGHIYVKSQIP